MVKKYSNVTLDRNQVIAIKSAILAGRKIQVEHPEIADMYRKGKFFRDIAKELNILEQYEITSEKVAISAVGYALRGVEEPFFGIDSYAGLIPRDELEDLCTKHNSENGRIVTEMLIGIHALTHEQRSKIGAMGGSIGGKEVYKRRIGVFAADYEEQKRRGLITMESQIGIFGLCEEERVKARLKGGERSRDFIRGVHALTHKQLVKIGHKAGSTSYNLKKGIHAFTKQQLSAAGTRGGRNSTLQRGMIPWERDEIQFCYEISQKPKYRIGTRTDRPNYQLIAETINSQFHDSTQVRNENAIKCKLRKYVSSKYK